MPIRREQLDVDVPVGATNNPCRIATTATDTLSGLGDRDGVTPVDGDRVLCKDQGTGSQNGIYNAAAGAWSRADDFDESSDVDPGVLTPIAEGTANGGTMWQLTTAAPITLGSTALVFEIIGRGGVDAGAHAADHLPSGGDPITTAAASALDGNSTSAEGSAESMARSDHTHAIDDSTGTNSTVNAGDSPADGSAAGFSKKDHQHGVATAAAGAIEPDDAAAEGVSTDLARADHTHSFATAAPAQGIGAGNSEGSASTSARSDHDHTIRETGAQDLTVGAISDGQLVERSGTTLAGTTAIDDTQHGTRGGGTLHADATTSVDGFMSAADKTKLDAIIDPRFRDFKQAVRLKSVGDIATLSGSQTVDGSSTADGDRIALFDQTTTTEDGIWVASTGAWSRAADFQAGDSAAGAFFASEEGTANADKTWLVTNDEGSAVIGTDDLGVTQIGAGSPRGAGAGLVLNVNDLDVVANADGSIVVNANDVQVGVITEAQHGNLALNDGLQHAAATGSFNGFLTSGDFTKLAGIDTGATATEPRQETVTTETINNSDTALADPLNNTPLYSAASLLLYLNGVMLRQGAGADYTVVAATGVITWLASSGTAPNLKTTDKLDAYYMT